MFGLFSDTNFVKKNIINRLYREPKLCSAIDLLSNVIMVRVDWYDYLI